MAATLEADPDLRVQRIKGAKSPIRVAVLRLDPFERLGFGPNESFMSFHFAFTLPGQRTTHGMQASASFNLDAVKKKIQEPQSAHGQ